jgi:hypothetical protein
MHRARANCILLMALSLALLADVGRAGVGMHDFRIVALGDDGSWRGAIDSAHGDWQSLL